MSHFSGTFLGCGFQQEATKGQPPCPFLETKPNLPVPDDELFVCVRKGPEHIVGHRLKGVNAKRDPLLDEQPGTNKRSRQEDGSASVVYKDARPQRLGGTRPDRRIGREGGGGGKVLNNGAHEQKPVAARMVVMNHGQS